MPRAECFPLGENCPLGRQAVDCPREGNFVHLSFNKDYKGLRPPERGAISRRLARGTCGGERPGRAAATGMYTIVYIQAAAPIGVLSLAARRATGAIIEAQTELVSESPIRLSRGKQRILAPPLSTLIRAAVNFGLTDDNTSVSVSFRAPRWPYQRRRRPNKRDWRNACHWGDWGQKSHSGCKSPHAKS
jgi:hypothetical protein